MKQPRESRQVWWLMANKGIYAVENLIWIIRVFFLVIIIFSTLVLVAKYSDIKSDTSNLDMQMLATKLVSTQNFAATDLRTARIYLASISSDKMIGKSDDVLSDSISYADNNFAAKIEKQDELGKPIGDPVYFNRDKFDRYFPQSNSFWTGVKSKVFIFTSSDGTIKVTVVKV